MLDLIIRGGTVVDGTGAPPRRADVAVTGGVITEVGRVDGPAARELDADGLLVTPGFVDVHTHFDGQATWDPHLTPSCWHGVTTVVMGNCGVGFAPVRPQAHDELIELMEGVEDIPGTALSEGMSWGWETFEEYLDALDAKPRSLDVGVHLPHAPLRAYVMGDRALDDASPDEVAQMAALVTRALRAGALGFSTGRTAGHRDVRGRAVPGTYAALDELSALMAAVREVGRGVFQVVPAGVGGAITGDAADAMDAELDWIVEQGITSGVPLTFLAMQQDSRGAFGGLPVDHWKPWFERVRAANDLGANIRPQVGARCFGVLMGLQSRLNPFQYRAHYRDIAHLPLAERVRALRDPARRSAILADEPDYGDTVALDKIGRRAMSRLFPLGDRLDYEPTPEQSIAAIAMREGRDPWEVAYDAMLGHDGKELLLLPLLNFGDDSYDGLLEMMSDPVTLQGLGDGGAHVGIVCDASMTTYLLSHWTRDRTRGPQLPLEVAVRRITGDPAAFYGLTDRGVLAPGLKADINVIDHANLRLVQPEQVNDLPGGAGRLVQRSEGYVATFVAGEQVIADGELTGALPGRLVRGSSS
ncbi:MAG TPA: amidohydrolase family protein [Mycobacteriales bacterium]|nr:amidohydrolase family protein [Mycobacteriales bacterium]